MPPPASEQDDAHEDEDTTAEEELADAAAAFGLRVVKPADDASAAPPRARLWPCNVPAWNAWLAVQTQWRHAGMVGLATGLDYASVAAYLRAQGIGQRARPGVPSLGQLLDDLRVCEGITLEEWKAKALQKRGRS